MSISNLLLAIWFLLFGLNGLGWLPLAWIVLPLLALIIAIVMLVTGLGAVNYNLPAIKRG